MTEQTCRHCKFYERILGKRQGFCRNPKSYYYNLKRQGGNRGADRCFVKEKESCK